MTILNSPSPMPAALPEFDPQDKMALARSARAKAAGEASKASRRARRVDPATCQKDYSGAEMEFLSAIQEYKKSSGRMFPTWAEALQVLEGLGYQK